MVACRTLVAARGNGQGPGLSEAGRLTFVKASPCRSGFVLTCPPTVALELSRWLRQIAEPARVSPDYHERADGHACGVVADWLAHAAEK